MLRILFLAILFTLSFSKAFALTNNFIDTTIALKDTSVAKQTNRQIIEQKLGRKLNFVERVELFVFGKRAFATCFSEEEQSRFANNSVSLSYWLALLSIIAPPAILFSILIKNSRAVKNKYLTPKSKNRLSVINVIATIWKILLGLVIVATILFMIYLVGYLFYALFTGLH